MTETDHHLLDAPVVDPADEKLTEGLRAILAELDWRELTGYTPWAFTNRLDRKR